MKNTYESPTLVEYGTIASLTGIVGEASVGDVLVDENGLIVQIGNHSIDTCAEEKGKCICSDNATC